LIITFKDTIDYFESFEYYFEKIDYYFEKIDYCFEKIDYCFEKIDYSNSDNFVKMVAHLIEKSHYSAS
jgi:hypothetical protein